MQARGWRLATCGLASSGWIVAGCSLFVPEAARPPGVSTTGPATQPTTRTAVAKTGFDPAKALLPLESILPAVQMPAPAEKPDRAIPPQAVKHYLAARDLFHRWMNAEAISELEEALRYDPGSAECHLLLGRSARRSGNLGQARNHLREAAKLCPDDVTCQYLLGWLAAKSGRSDEALQHFRLALMCSDADPKRAETLLTRFRIGEVLMAQGYLSAGIEQFEAFEEAVADTRGRSWRNRELLTLIRTRPALPAWQIGQAAMQLHRYDQASRAFERVLKREPDNPRAKVRYAQTLARSKRREKALELARELALSKDKPEAGVELLGWIYRDAKRPEGLTQELQKLLEAHPDRGELGTMLAETLIGFGHKDQAERVLRQLIKDKPELVPAYVRLAGLLREQGRAAEAVRVLAGAIAAGPQTHAGVLRAVAQLGSDTKTVRQLIGQAEKILAADEKSHALNYVMGLVAYHGDRQDLAVRYFDRTVELKPGFLPAYLSLGRLYVARFEWEPAIEVADRAEKAGHKTPAVTYLRAQGHDGLDDIDKAVKAYQQVIQADPKSVAAMVALGRSYERMGQPNKARKEYQRVLKIAPANDVAGERLIRLLLAQGEGEEAKRALQRFRRANGGRGVLGRCLAVMASGGDMGRYRRLLGKLLEQSPKEPQTRYDLAVSFYSTRAYDRAREEVDRVLELAPGHQRARLLIAGLCRKQLNYGGAVKVLAGLLREHPNRHAWLLRRAEVHLDMQDYDRAAEVFKRLIARAPNTGYQRVYRHRLVGVHLAARKHDQGVAVAERWVKEDPTCRTARRMLVEALHEAGKDDQAIQLAKDWLAADAAKAAKADKGKSDEGQQEGRSLLMAVYVAAKQTDQALETLTGWMEEDPSNRSLFRQTWIVLSNAKRYEDAAELCRSAIVTVRRPQGYRLMLAQTYLDADQYDKALDVLKGIPKSARDNLVRRLEISALLDAKRYDQAARVAKEAAGRAQEDGVQLAMSRLLVLVYQRQDKMDLAEKELERIYAKQPKDPGINNDLGYTWADTGRNVERAERMVRYALGEEPRNAAYMDSLGWVLYKKGDFAPAVHFLRKATRAAGGDDPIIFDHLGDACWRLGRRDEAKQHWQQAVKLSLKEQSEGKDPADPKMLSRARKKLTELEQGAEPTVSDVAGPAASTQQTGAGRGGPSSSSAQAEAGSKK